MWGNQCMVKKKTTYKYRLFGMAGSWEEYWIFADKKEDLFAEAKFHLRYGHDAWIEDCVTGAVTRLSFKKRDVR